MCLASRANWQAEGVISNCELYFETLCHQKEIFKNGTFLNFKNPMDFLYAMGILIITELG